MNEYVKRFLSVSARYIFDRPGMAIEVRWASTHQEIIQAQTLRRMVFQDEFDASFSEECDRDSDHFDPYCKHLVAVDLMNNEVVGCTRVLLPEGARQAGGWYLQREFSAEFLDRQGHQFIELGRTCIHPEYRQGWVLRKLWLALARFFSERSEQYLIGCVSVRGSCKKQDPQRLSSFLQRRVGAEKHFNARPINPLPSGGDTDDCRELVPPLMKSYLKLGAKVIGPPSADLSFKCVDFPMLASIQEIESRLGKSNRYDKQPA